MKKTLAKFTVLLISILLMGALGAIYSLIFAGVAGWSMIGINPSLSFGLVGQFVCPAGAGIQYPADFPSSANPDSVLVCRSQDGKSYPNQGLYGSAVFAIYKAFFLLCFVPTFIPGAILMWLSIHRWTQKIAGLDEQSFEPAASQEIFCKTP